jgi:hypothetical protein
LGRIIIDEETGQIESRMFPGDRILRAKSLEAYKKNEQKRKLNNSIEPFELENYFKGHVNEIVKLMKELSQNERAFLFSVAPYVGYEDCCLKYPNGRELDSEALEKITGMSTRTLYRTLFDLIKKDIIYKGKNSYTRQYFVNPWIFCKGQRINKVLKTMFKNYRVRVAGNVRWGDLK